MKQLELHKILLAGIFLVNDNQARGLAMNQNQSEQGRKNEIDKDLGLTFRTKKVLQVSLISRREKEGKLFPIRKGENVSLAVFSIFPDWSI